MPEVKTYIGSKIIQAYPSDEFSFLRSQNKPVPSRENRAGYTVIYPDGYESWSPANVFEEAYRLLNPGERTMCKE